MSDLVCKGECGACCLHSVIPPFSPEELGDLPDELLAPIEEFRSGKINPNVPLFEQTGTKVCSWYDETGKACLHYEHRPRVCRGFVVGGPACLEARRLVGLTIEGA